MADNHMFQGMEGPIQNILKQAFSGFLNQNGNNSQQSQSADSGISQKNIADVASGIMSMLSNIRQAGQSNGLVSYSESAEVTEDAAKTQRAAGQQAAMQASANGTASGISAANSGQMQMPGQGEENFLSKIAGQLGLPGDLAGKIMSTLSSFMKNFNQAEAKPAAAHHS